MKGYRTVTLGDAARLLGAWADRRIPHDPSAGAPIHFELEDACDGVCRWLAEDPERDLGRVPPELMLLLRRRLLFAIGAARLRPDETVISLPLANSDDERVLEYLLDVTLAGTRVPSEWRLQ